MIERIKEENVWDFLKKDGKPVMIYGMGNGAEKIISTLNTYQITVSEIFASDEFVRGHSFLGYKVLKYSEVCEKYDDFNVVLAFATHLENVIENIKKINNEHKVFAPDVPVAGGGLFTREYVKEHNAAYFDDDMQDYLDKAAKPKEEERFDSNETADTGDTENNELFKRALWLAVNSGTVAISQLQRRFQIGYARAGGLVDKMERMGFISGNEGSKARRVNLTVEEFEEKFGPIDDAY